MLADFETAGRGFRLTRIALLPFDLNTPDGIVVSAAHQIERRSPLTVPFYTRRMRHIAGSALLAIVATTQLLLAQTPLKPTTPGNSGDPAWQGVIHLADGRTFVTDGGLAIDAAFAKPAQLPNRELPPRVLDQYLNAAHKNEYGFSDLSAAASGRSYTAPNGIPLNATYVNFLRRTLSAPSVRFRMNGDMQPVVIVARGTAVGVLMPMKQ